MVKAVIYTNINYEKMRQTLNEYGKYILNCIKNQYSSSLTKEQIQNIDCLLNTNFIIIERPTKEDNKIHIYSYAKSYSQFKTDDEIIELCINNIVVYEIFHYFIRPNWDSL